MRCIGQRLGFALAVALLVLAPCAHAANYGGKGNASAPATKKQKATPGAEIFNNQTVLALTIEISSNELVTLRKDDRKPIRATVREGSNVWRDVALHVKGAAGSRRGIDDKPALTLAFGKFAPGQRFYGLRKIHLNNSVQDASYMTENICGELFRKAGVPAARVSYATLNLNGRQRGLYVLKEGFEKEMLGIYFRNTKGNLYDGGFLREITDPLERDNGAGDDVEDRSDLRALAQAAQEPDPLNRWEALHRVLDMDRFLSFAAMEVMTWDWDGYLMNRNNYRVFHDLDTGKMVFLPHGMDQMFWEPTRPVLPPDKIDASLVGRAVLRTPQGKAAYRQRFGVLFTNVFQIETLTNRVNELAALLRPAITNVSGLHAGNEFDGQVKRIRELITARHRHLEMQLNLPDPVPLKFENNMAKLTGWEVPVALREKGESKRDKPLLDGRPTLRIQAVEPSAGSWRTRVMLEAGEYRFEARVKTSGVESVPDPKKGEGAGIRHSGTQKPRDNKVVGTTDWQALAYPFTVQVTGEEIWLLCELRASAGEAWFDLESLKLVKVK
jgi:spore coat protein H